MKALLAFEGVSLVRAGVRLLDRIDLSIAPGDRLAVVGESGSGKGWLLRLALGLVDPGSGVVRLMGVALDSADTDQRRLLRARCGVAMQGGSLLGELTVEENMQLALDIGAGSSAARRIDRLLLDYGLEPIATSRADTLSAGERRRAELARAFVRDPDLVILDEPFEGAYARADALEAQVRRRIIPHGRALLLLTQDAALAGRLCDRVLRLERGCVVQQAAAVTPPVATS